MNIKEAVQILVENKSTIIWEDEETAKRAMLFNEAIDTVANSSTPAEIELEGGGSTWWHVCGECHGPIDSSDSFCRHCGKPIEKRKSGCDGCTYKGSEDCILGQQGSENAFCPNGRL